VQPWGAAENRSSLRAADRLDDASTKPVLARQLSTAIIGDRGVAALNRDSSSEPPLLVGLGEQRSIRRLNSYGTTARASEIHMDSWRRGLVH
jgi:hypothetical protein